MPSDGCHLAVLLLVDALLLMVTLLHSSHEQMFFLLPIAEVSEHVVGHIEV